MTLPEGFFEHFCQSDGWDEAEYAAVRAEAPAAGNREP
jgi:hypothetical protein